jgi:succinate-acetate transporter protein
LATVAFNSYGAFWLWFGLLELFAVNGLIAPSPAVVGVTLIIWGGYFGIALFIVGFYESVNAIQRNLIYSQQS